MKKRTQTVKGLGIKVKDFNKAYRNYSRKYDEYSESGFTRSDKMTKSEFKDFLAKNKRYADENESRFSVSRLVKAKFREQTTIITDGGGISGKTARRWYESYVREFEKAKDKLGGKMYDSKMMDFNEYMANRKIYKDMGITQNVNRQMVTDQSYEYTMTNAMNIKKLAMDYGIDDIAEANVRDIMRGDIDLSAAKGDGAFLSELNNALKNAHPDWNGSYRADFIAHAVYGS